MIYFSFITLIFWIISPLLPIHFAVSLTVLFSHVAHYDQALFAAMVLGVTSDVLAGRPVGLTSLLLVAAVLFLTLLKKQFDLPKMVTLAGGGIALELLMRILSREEITLTALLVQALFCLVFMRLLEIRAARGASVYLKGE